MLFDWFTIIAQLINFLILIWLLKRFLYKPILDAIDEREVQIAGKLSTAEKIQLDAENKNMQLEIKLKEINEKRLEVLANATSDAKIERQRLFDKAKNEIEIYRDTKNEKIKHEEKDIHEEIIKHTQLEIFAITRKVLSDLAETTLESHLIDVFIQRLSDLDEEQKKNINKGVIRSTTDLSLAQRAFVEKAFNKYFNSEVQLKFEIVPELLSGIEFVANGQKIAWCINDYLSSLEKEVDEILKLRRPSS